MTKLLILILCVLFAFIYHNYTTLPNKNFDLIQTNIQDVSLKMVFEKIPIVINQQIKTPFELTNTIFKYLYIYKVFDNGLKTNYNCKAKYALVYCDSDYDLTLKNPLYKDQVILPLKHHQCVIIPHMWVISSSKKVNLILMYDLMTLFNKII